MNSQNRQCYVKGANEKTEDLLLVSLRDVPIEVRRREATEPLYLLRYE
jgi:hypothetical protein